MLNADAWVAGVDGCRAGWIVALRPLADAGSTQLRFCKAFSDILELPEAPAIIAIDIPIGLAAVTSTGGRLADREARANLGGRQSAVFSVPPRAAVMETDYRAACDVALLHSNPPRRISKQAFFLFAKIREVDALMTPALQDRVMECHPELAFWALNAEQPLDLPKKVKSRAHEPGLQLRRDLLAGAGYGADVLSSSFVPTSMAGADDILDAVVNSWSAARIAHGTARRFPADPQIDDRGLRMEIWG